MKNFKLLKQIDFSGGMNVEAPDAIAQDAQLRRIVNMFPSDDGHSLILRGSFDNIAAIELPTISDRVIGFFPFRGWVSDTETGQSTASRSNELLVAYVNDGDTVISRIIPYGYYAAEEELISNQQLWTESGEDPDYYPGVDIMPPVSYQTYSKNISDVFIDSVAPETGYTFMRDYWVSEDSGDTYGDGSTNRMGNNMNKWTSEDYDFANDWDSAGWYDDWIAGSSNDNRLFDMWSSESSPYGETDIFEFDSDGNPVFTFPFMYNEEDTSVTGINQKIVIKPYIDIRFDCEQANIPHYILFPKNDLSDTPHTLDNAIGFIVSAKKNSDYTDDDIEWTLLSDGTTSLPIPVIPVDQSTITLESERYDEVTVDGTDYVKLSFRVPWAGLTVIRIEGIQAGDVFSGVDYSGIVEKIGVE